MSFLQDVRHALRIMGRTPGLTAAALLTLALGIGANTAIFSVVYGVLLRPLPYPDADALVQVSESRSGPGRGAGMIRGAFMTNLTYHAWSEPRTVEGLAAYATRAFTERGGDEPVRLRGAAVSPALFDLLRVPPAAGRLLAPDDAVPGAAPVAVLSHAFWQERFGGRADTIGQALALDGTAYTIVGVMPPAFYFPDREARLWTAFDVPRPSTDPNNVSVSIIRVLGRLAPGATPAQAAAEGTAAASGDGAGPSLAAGALMGRGGEVTVRVEGLVESMTASVRPALLVLAAGVGLVLLIACANVANLFLSQGLARRRELAVRTALGAGRRRLVSQLLTESFVLAGLGGLLGLGLAWALARALPAIAPASFPRLDDVQLDARVLVFAVAVAAFAALVSGLVPALRGARLDLLPALREGAGATDSARARRLKAVLLAGEAALAVLLLVGASLLVRSFTTLVQVDPGYDPANVLTARIYLPGAERGAAQAGPFLDELLSRLRAVPGVAAAGASNMTPLGTSTAVAAFQRPEVGPDGEPVVMRALAYAVTPGYAEAMGLTLREGRFLEPRDEGAGVHALVINEEFARTYFSDGQPVVGRRLEGFLGPGPDSVTEIVGIVGTVLKDGLDAEAQAEMYSLPRGPGALGREINLVVRTAGDPLALAPTLRTLVRDIERQAALDAVGTMASRVSASVAQPRFAMALLVTFATLALVLAATGLYGVLSYSVSQRRREIGVRAALGASRGDIVGLVVRQGMGVTVAGLVVGLAGAVLATPLMESLLFGITSLDAMAYLSAPIALLLVALAAAAIPARRAAALDPARMLREE